MIINNYPDLSNIFLNYLNKHPFLKSRISGVKNIELYLSKENTIEYLDSTKVIINSTTKNGLAVLLGYILVYPGNSFTYNNCNKLSHRILQFTPQEDNLTRLWELAMSGCTGIQFCPEEINSELIQMCHKIGLKVSVLITNYLHQNEYIKDLNLDCIYCQDMFNFIEVKHDFYNSEIWLPEYHTLDLNDTQIKGYFYCSKYNKEKLSQFRKNIPLKYPIHLIANIDQMYFNSSFVLFNFVHQGKFINYNPNKSNNLLNFISNYCQGFIYLSSSYQSDISNNFELFFWSFCDIITLDEKIKYYVILFLKQSGDYEIEFWSQQIKRMEDCLWSNNINSQYGSVVKTFDSIIELGVGRRNNWRLNLLLLRNLIDYYLCYRFSCENYVKENIIDVYQKKGVSIYTKQKYVKLVLKKSGFKFDQFIQNYKGGVTKPQFYQTHSIMEKIQFLCGSLFQSIGIKYQPIIDKLNIPLTGLWRFYKLFEKNIILVDQLLTQDYYFYINFGLKCSNNLFELNDFLKKEYNPLEKVSTPKIDVINLDNQQILDDLYAGTIDERALYFLNYKDEFNLKLPISYFKKATKIAIMLIGQDLVKFDHTPELILNLNNQCIQSELKQPKKTKIIEYNIELLILENNLNIQFKATKGWGIPIGFIGFS